MAKIKHIAIATQDPDKTAKFYINVLGLKEIAKINSQGATGYHLSDGDINFAILKFKNDQVAGIENGKEVSGLHHIGFEVESLEETEKNMAAFNVQQRDDINSALGVGMGQPRHVNVEVKFGGPDGVIIDLSETGWAGTSRHPR